MKYIQLYLICFFIYNLVSGQEVNYSKVNITPYEIDWNKRSGDIIEVIYVISYNKLSNRKNDTISITKYLTGLKEKSKVTFRNNQRNLIYEYFYNEYYYGWEYENNKAYQNIEGFKKGIVTYSNKNGDVLKINEYALKENGDTLGTIPTKYIYNKKGKIIKSESERFRTEFEYDKQGNLSKQISGSLTSSGTMNYPTTVVYNYDLKGYILEELTYNYNEQLTSSVLYEYNSLNLLKYSIEKQIDLNKQKEYFYSYDFDGRIASMVIKEGGKVWDVKYTYNEFGKLIEKQTISEKIYPNQRIPISYDLESLNYKYTSPGNYVERFFYDRFQNVISKEILINEESIEKVDFIIKYLE